MKNNVFGYVDDTIYVGENKFYNFSEAAKIIGKEGFGRNNLLKLLRDKGVFDRFNTPTPEWENKGLFKNVDNKYLTPLVSGYGINYIKKNFM